MFYEVFLTLPPLSGNSLFTSPAPQHDSFSLDAGALRQQGDQNPTADVEILWGIRGTTFG